MMDEFRPNSFAGREARKELEAYGYRTFIGCTGNLYVSKDHFLEGDIGLARKIVSSYGFNCPISYTNKKTYEEEKSGYWVPSQEECLKRAAALGR